MQVHAGNVFRRATCCVVPPCSSSLSGLSIRCYAADSKKEKPKPKFRLDRGPFASQLDYQSRLQLQAPAMSVPLSGIICTIGPATQRADMLLKLMRAGMRVVRMNFSHGTHEYHCKTIQEARKAIAMYQEETGLPRTVALALDTKGPEIRTGKLAGGSDTAEIELKKGEKVTLSANKELEKNCTKEKIYMDYQKLGAIVKPGNRIFIDDGLIALVVKESKADEVICEVENGGKLGSHKGINLPGIAVDLPAITEKDKQDLKFGAEQQVDMIFASFIRDAKALADIRQALGPTGGHIKVISKIENQQGLENIDEIIGASDGIMVARGDMGIEIPTEHVPLAQKSIIAKCNKVGKPVVCATQMMDSMTTKPRPSRAEASDVANAIIDGADAVMLSGETAKGKYPVECVRVMAKICAKIEAVLWYESLQNNLKREIRTCGGDHISAVTTAIAEAATVGQARAIVVASPCSMVAQMVSHMRPACPILMLTGCRSQAAQSLLFRGIYPLLVEDMVIGNLDFRQVMKSGLRLMGKMNLLQPGQKGSVVLVNAMSADKVTFRLFTIQQQTKEEREQEELCRKLAIEKRCKERAEKKECQKFQEAEKCRKMEEAEKCRKMEEAEKCRKMAEAEKCKAKEKPAKSECHKQKPKTPKIESCKLRVSTDDSKCKQFKQDKKGAGACKKMAEKNKCKSAADKAKEEAELKIIEEEMAKLKAAEKAKQAEAEAKKKADIEKCKQLAEEKRKKEKEEKCKQKDMEAKRAEMAKRWKEVEAERKKKEEAKQCKKLAEENRKRRKKVADAIVEAVCKKVKEQTQDNNNKDKKK